MKNYGLNPATKETYPLQDWETPEFGQKVGVTSMADVTVSTVFLCMDHNYSGVGEPILFETMVFGGECDGEMARYRTWNEAVKGHEEMRLKAFASIEDHGHGDTLWHGV